MFSWRAYEGRKDTELLKLQASPSLWENCELVCILVIWLLIFRAELYCSCKGVFLPADETLLLKPRRQNSPGCHSYLGYCFSPVLWLSSPARSDGEPPGDCWHLFKANRAVSPPQLCQDNHLHCGEPRWEFLLCFRLIEAGKLHFFWAFHVSVI